MMLLYWSNLAILMVQFYNTIQYDINSIFVTDTFLMTSQVGFVAFAEMKGIDIKSTIASGYMD